jgi:hypothetical protein
LIDYKSFQIENTAVKENGCSLQWWGYIHPSAGVSTILLDMETFWTTRKDYLILSFSKYLKDDNLSLSGLMFTFIEEEEGNDAILQWQLGLISHDEDLLNQLIPS